MTVYQLRMKLHIPPSKKKHKHLTSYFSDVHQLQHQQSKFVCFDKINDYLEKQGYQGIKRDIPGHLRQLQDISGIFFTKQL